MKKLLVGILHLRMLHLGLRHLKMLFLLLMICLFFSLNSIISEVASLHEFIYGTTESTSYDNWLSHTSEGITIPGVNTYPPYDNQTEGFGFYKTPSDSELEDWAEIVEHFIQGDLEGAEEAIQNSGFPYEVGVFYDTDTNRIYHILREILNYEYFDDNGTTNEYDDVTGSFDNSWGLFIHNPETSSHVLVNVVHPNDDFIAVPIAVKAMQDWDAKFLFINGAGREVQADNDDGELRTISDPSRVSDHPFNTVYTSACDLIRQQCMRRELSVQIHSYDWDKHFYRAACQVSSGNGRDIPNLPIRDVSDFKRDLINLTDYVVIPANTIDDNGEMLIYDYYSVYYYDVEFTYNHNGDEINVNSAVDLPGYSGNIQMHYSSPNSLNPYDVIEPFFHLEMDEFPNCYLQTEENYKEFYGFNTESGTYNFDEIFTRTFQFYTPWVDAMTEALSYLYEFDDGEVPLPIENLFSSSQNENEITLEWEPISSYDFESYKIIYACEPLEEDNYITIDRTADYTLASQHNTSVTITNLFFNQAYYFKIASYDYNGNISEYSDELMIMTSPVEISSFKAVGQDNQCAISWDVDFQFGNIGFTIYRSTNDGSTNDGSTDDGEFEEIVSYLDDPGLIGGNDPGYYEYLDQDVENGKYYSYKLGTLNLLFYENILNEIALGSPRAIYRLDLIKLNGSAEDSVTYSANPYSSSYFDSDYDITKDYYESDDELYMAFYLQYGSHNYLQQNVISYFDADTELITMELKVRCDQADEPLQLTTTQQIGRTDRDFEKLYIYNNETKELENLLTGIYEFTLPDTSLHTLTLIWGDLLPDITFRYQQNQIFQEGELVWVCWESQFSELIEFMNLYLENDDESIALQTNISADTDSVLVTMPGGYNLHQLHFSMRINSIYNEERKVISYEKMGLVELTQQISLQEGWQSFSYPFIDHSVDFTDLFGDEYQLFSLNAWNEYEPTELMDHTKGYLLYAPGSTQFQDSGDITSTSYSTQISPGWNLISNLFSYNYPISSLSISGLSYNDLVNYEVISPITFVYESGSYKECTYIKPNQSALIYFNYDNDIYCDFGLYESDEDLPSYNTNVAKIAFSQQDRDYLVIGYGEGSTDEFDFFYDLPAPPIKPAFNTISARIIPYESDTTMIYDYLYQECKDQLDSDSTDETVYYFEIVVNSLEPIEISLSESNLPETYAVVINFEGEETTLTEEDVVYYPTELGFVYGTLHLRNQYFTSMEDQISIMDGFINYPNPFNPSTTFAFQLVAEQKVELDIYNIKGQKVVNLIKEQLAAGNYKYKWAGADKQGRRVGSGIYFSKLQKGGKVFFRKIVLLK